jgi:uncharacterized protein (TIGR02302 family)
MQAPQRDGTAERPDPQARRLERRIFGSRLALTWEKAWPLVWVPLSIVLVFLTVSWLGLWLALPWQARAVGVVLFALAFGGSILRLARAALPSAVEATARLDRSVAGAHRPAAALGDRLAVGSRDPVAEALWQAHLGRQRKLAEALRVVPPRPNVPARDRFALRAVPLIAAIAAVFVAGPDALDRIRGAFHWSGGPLVSPPLRVDGWIDPPAYTRLPPIILDFNGKQTAEQHILRVPEKSVVVVRVAGSNGGIAAVATGRIEPLKEAADGASAAKPGVTSTSTATGGEVSERRFTISGSGTIGLTGRRAPPGTITIAAIVDQSPEISFVEPPKPGNRGQLTVTYRAKDDYGLVGAEAIVERIGPAKGGRSLVEAPRGPLALPAGAAGEEETKTTLDFSAHPWAGAKVRIVLQAQDEAGQTGRSEFHDITLPQRPFSKPLAKSLVEERRRLVIDIDTRRRVQISLDALLIEPDRFTKDKGVYLGLRMLSDRLRNARNDTDLIDVADLMWAMALQIEDGGLSDAERDLRAAQERLQQAIENNASAEEIKRLTEEMRRAMDKFMREFAQRSLEQQRDGNRDLSRLPENFRTVTPQDLQNLLNRIEELTRQGDLAEAQRLLEELRNILENLQMARPGQGDQNQREMNRALGELDALSRDQQALRDETFKQEQNQRARPGDRRRDQQTRPGNGQRQQQGQQQGQRQQGQRGQQGQQGDQGEDGDQGEGEGEGQQGQGGQSLSERQQALRDRLDQLQRRMKGLGAQGSEGLGEADQAMGEAGNALGQGRGGEATDAQGRAIDALRKGAQDMARQMQPGNEEGDGTEQAEGGPGNPNGQPRSRADQRTSEDPLGRPQRSRDWSDGRVKVPGEGESATVRARRILEELRRRLGESTRPQEELEYFERLLRRN